MEEVRRWMLLTLLIVTCLSIVSGQCWPSEVEKCEAHIERYSPRANVKYYSANNLAKFCKARPTYDACINALLPYCREKYRAQLKGIQTAYEYQCSPDIRQLVVNSEVCLKKNEAQLLARDCGLDYQMNVNSAEGVSMDCGAVNGYLECLRDALGQMCGGEVGLMVRNFTIYTLTPLYEGRNCPLGYATDSSAQLIPGIMLLTTLVAFICICVQ
jgi:hypothetical protein